MRRVLVAAVSAVVAAAFLTILIAVAIWPGEAQLTAPLFCAPPATEPMVVSDTFHDAEGTSTNYTLYCVGDRGVVTDAGFALPMLVLFGAHVLILGALLLVGTLISAAGTRPEVQDERLRDS
ncbi:MAG: hypothetical protein H5T78_11865 [Nocardia sp.]|nr:hypothetical protein [Nocardia sp.]